MINRQVGVLLLGVIASAASSGAERAIAVPAKAAMSWGFMTNTAKVQPSRQLGVGFWQRGSGAKPGVGDVFVSAMEYQLPEAAPTRVRSATFQFSGKPSQCVGAEPVVIDVYAYVGDGRLDVADANAGTRIAQMQADCNDHAAFARPIDVTQFVRQASVASGIRHVGFNMRKANNRQGPGLFYLAAGKLTIVVSDQDIAQLGRAPNMARPTVASATTSPALPPRLGTTARGQKVDERKP